MKRLTLAVLFVGSSFLSMGGCSLDACECEESIDCGSGQICDGCDCVAGGTGGSGGAAGSGGSGGAAGSGGSSGEQCAEGEFQLSPVAGAPSKILREVCFHSMGSLGPCPVYNYRIPPSTDFSEFIDIFYGGRGPECEDSMLGEFVEAGERYLMFGDPTREPPSTPTASSETVATGNYSIEGGPERGTFEYYWPARP